MDQIVKSYRLKINKKSRSKIFYYLKRDLIGYGRMDVLMSDANVEDVSLDGTNIPIDGLAGCMDPEPVDARKTIYPGVRHLGWNITYDLSADHDIYAWMLSHVNENASLD